MIIRCEQSINTWLNPELIIKILKNEYYFTCENCGQKIFLNTDILINCSRGIFYINTAAKLEDNIKKLLEFYFLFFFK